MKNMKKIALFLFLVAAVYTGLQAWDDEKLFTTTTGGHGKYNMILVQDHTGSMSEIIYHPDFDPTVLYAGGNPNIGNLSQTSWFLRWVNSTGSSLGNPSGYAYISNWVAATNTLTLRTNKNTATKIKNGDWILQRQSNSTSSSNYYNINSQMYAKVTGLGTPTTDTTYRYQPVTLDPATIVGTPTVGYYVSYYTDNSSSYTTKLVKLYGTAIGQSDVSYDSYYQRWIFCRATDAQRQQVTNFSTLGYDIEYNNYLIATTDTRYPVSPVNAMALKKDNSNSTTTLLAEWNTVMKDIFPSKIATLNTNLTSSGTSFAYTGAKDSLADYDSLTGFLIKIDAETLQVTSLTPDPDKEGCGTFTVAASGRGYNNTTAKAHSSGAAIMIYDNGSLGISEYTPSLHVFSSMQYVTESTGDVDPSWTTTTDYSGKTTYRYKRIFTRMQTAREAICDMVTAKNTLSSVADLATAATDADTTLIYCNVNADFADWVAPFYIKVVDPGGSGNAEVMKVTAHDNVAYTLTVTRAQQGTTACSHSIYSKVLVYSGTRDMVRIGIFDYPTTDTQGGVTAKLLVGLNDFGQKNADGTYKAASYINTTILEQVHDLTSNSYTPLAKALALVWNYLKPNPGSGTSNYIRQTGTSDWKAVDESTFGTAEKFETIDGVTHPKGSPIEYWCQKNYVVLVTDGEATADNNITNGNYGVFKAGTTIRSTGTADVPTDFFLFDYNNTYGHGTTPWGDTDSHDPTYSGTDYCPNNSCWQTINSTYWGTDYLDDVAFFLAHQDMFPTKKPANLSSWNGEMFTGSAAASTSLYNESDTDPRKQWHDNQIIQTFTIGLAVNNDMLAETAHNGEGLYFTASNYKDLAEAFTTIVTTVSLLSTPMTYTTYAAPKQSITGGKYGYVAHFIPQERAVWEGHLRRFRLSDEGDFPDDIDNPAAMVNTGSGLVVSFQWDAMTKLTARTTTRVLYTAKKESGAWVRKNFMDSDITYSDLDVTNALATQVKNFTLNMLDSTGTAISTYASAKLGETFHFNPQLVGYPLKWKSDQDSSYKSFYQHFAEWDDNETTTNPTARKEVVYAGANDGKLHCFQASDGEELWSYIPYSQLTRLKTPALNPEMVTSHTYFNDGKSVVKDIKMGTTYTGTDAWKNWKTGLFYGMGIGGRSYCALDVTNPDDPQVLWEFDDGYSATNIDGRMGFTEAKPIVVDMNAGSGTLPAALLSGGYNETEIAVDTGLAYQDWQKKEGKALYVLDARNGNLIKKLLPGTGTDTATIGYLAALKYAVTAAPVLFDSNLDGIADYAYFAETGDPVVANGQGARIWKMNCFGSPIDWKAQVIYQAPAGQTVFISPTIAYDENWRVWVMFGTGRRSQAAFGTGGVFSNLRGQFVAFMDDGSGTTITNSDLDNVTTDIQTAGADTYELEDSGGTTISRGFFFNFFMDTNEIMFEPSPLYVSHVVYFMTFSPHAGTGSSSTTDDPCSGSSSVGGMHYIYRFTLTSEGNTFTIGGDFLAQSGKILGYGPMDDKWKPYFGDGAAGNFKPDTTNAVDLSNVFGPMLWKEDKQ